MIKVATLALFILLFSCSYNSKKLNSKITPRFKEDLHYLVQKLEDIHPNLYYKISKDRFRLKVDSIGNSLPLNSSRISFYTTISKLLKSIGDGHTRVEIGDLINDSTLVLPFQLSLFNSTLYIKKNFSENMDLDKGVKILSINSVKVDKIIKRIREMVCGERKEFIDYKIARNLPFYYYLLYPNKQTYLIEYLENGEHNTAIVKPILFKKFKNQSYKKLEQFEKRVLNDNTILLEINCFTNPNRFKEYIDLLFEEIKINDIKNLIIDIRKNGGGSSFLGEYLAYYLTRKSICSFSRVEIKNSAHVKDQITDGNLFKNLIYTIFMEGDIEVKHKNQLNLGRYYQKFVNNRFYGELYLLTSSYTFSAATDFASIIKDYGIGTIVGEETGGLASSFGDLKYFKLPESKLLIGCSSKYFVRPSGDEDRRGVIPDYQLENSGLSEDPVLDYTLKLIE